MRHHVGDLFHECRQRWGVVKPVIQCRGEDDEYAEVYDIKETSW